MKKKVKSADSLVLPIISLKDDEINQEKEKSMEMILESINITEENSNKELNGNRGESSRQSNQEYFKQDSGAYDNLFSKDLVEGCELENISKSYASWSWRQFFEFFIYHLSYYFIGPFNFFIFMVIHKNLILYQNLGFQIGSHFSLLQLVAWILVLYTSVQYLVNNQVKSKFQFFEIYSMWLSLIFRMFSVSCKYAMLHPIFIRVYKKQVLTLDQKLKEFYLIDWATQSSKAVIQEVFSAIKRNEIEIALFIPKLSCLLSEEQSKDLLDIQKTQSEFCRVEKINYCCTFIQSQQLFLDQLQQQQLIKRLNSQYASSSLKINGNGKQKDNQRIDKKEHEQNSPPGAADDELFPTQNSKSYAQFHNSDSLSRVIPLEIEKEKEPVQIQSNSKRYYFYSGAAILQYLIESFNNSCKQIKDKKIIIFVAIFRTLISIVYKLAHYNNYFSNITWVEVTVIISGALVNFWLQYVIGAFMIVLITDLARINYLMIQMLFLIQPKKDEQYIVTKKVFPTIDLVCCQNFKIWIQLRRLCFEYGKKFWLRGQSNLSFMVIYSLYPVVCLFLHLLDIFTFQPLEILTLSYDFLIISLSVSACLYYSAAINDSYSYHISILEEIRIIFRNLKTDSSNSDQFSSYLYKTLLIGLKNNAYGDCKKLTANIKKIISAIDDVKSELVLLSNTHPFECFGISITFAKLKSILLFLSSLLTYSVNFYMKTH